MTAPLPRSAPETRVLIVDDSVFMRHAIERQIAGLPGVTVVGTARDGIEGVQKALELRPDVITMDVEMPRMDGVSAVREIMQTVPTPIVMVSTLTVQGANVTIEALEAGAVDYVAKPSGLSRDLANLGDQLAQKIVHARHARVWRRKPAPRRPASTPPAGKPAADGRPAEHLVVIGSSTGGPPALTEVIPGLPADFPAGVVVVQHMPPGFTDALARRLDVLSPLHVREAKEGDTVSLGTVLVAPGDYHLTLARGGRVSLNQEPPVHGVRPSVDITLNSVPRAYGSDATVAILTGMGRDGGAGAALVENAGGKVFVQDEASSVVYGMPRVAHEMTEHATEAPLDRIAGLLTRHVSRVS